MPVYQIASQNILDFCSILRAQGFTVGPKETQDALIALTVVQLEHYHQVKNALSLVFCSNHEEEESFDVLFRSFFLPEPRKKLPPESQAKAHENGGDETGEEAPQKRKKQQAVPKDAVMTASSLPGEAQESEDDVTKVGSALTLKAFFSPFSSTYETPVEVSGETQEEMRDAARKLIAKVRLGRSRRWRSMPKGSRFYFRKTLRQSLSTGGETLKPAWLGHPLRKPRFVLLLDSSRSMISYSNQLLQFARALSQCSTRVDVYLFSTNLKRVTKDLKKARASASLSLNDLGEAYGGGTQIGRCLAAFMADYAHGALTPDTVVLIASDGLDTGKPYQLARAMRDLHRRSSAVVWLNPLLETEGYQPTATGMQAALPYIDTFCTVKDSASFERLSRQVRLR